MDDGGEWCTVKSKHHNHNHYKNDSVPENNNANNRRRSKKDTTSTRGKSTKPDPRPRRKSAATNKTDAATTIVDGSQNPYHLAEHDDSNDEDEEDDTVDLVDDPVPPYHTTILTVCPLPDCPSDRPFLDTTALTDHFKADHQATFKNLHHMYMALDPYLKRWGALLRSKPIAEYGTADSDNEDVYIIDPRKCELDQKLRTEMQRHALDEVLSVQQKERDGPAKEPRKCLFCKVICDNRTALFKHMFSEHNFNIGLPDNIVNVNEFLDLLESKLIKLQCLYCEKTFTSAPVLRKHMRKKKHFKIASKNRQYDKFYVINYLEPGKNWEHFERDNCESDEEKSDATDDSWAEWDEEEPEVSMCLLCPQTESSPQEAWSHMEKKHAFDLNRIRKQLGLDFYKTIVLINYIRHQSSLDKCFVCGTTVDDFAILEKHLEEKNCVTKPLDANADFWKDPKYLLPTYEGDPLLTGFDDDSDMEDDEKETTTTKQ
ncbi:hypothetical protein BDB00DRAFT_783941 [Zychaea mexicana]|uniref:uncharacterized protein n=1 Tax=Zychaea mexicana TaxID=64656 RepID=UPI0022FE7498|nr:uncharacterized protein BDB00DRAFT_783941 [Zychaea mexicana]KAI9498303.1 hypothetical protein BDB00DRAFT_783941 [Zychaea mexicana]